MCNHLGNHFFWGEGPNGPSPPQPLLYLGWFLNKNGLIFLRLNVWIGKYADQQKDLKPAGYQADLNSQSIVLHGVQLPSYNNWGKKGFVSSAVGVTHYLYESK